MAILKSVVDVNNGNTGWTKADVMDALETVFANLGWNSGTQRLGVPQALVSPANIIGASDTWRRVGGQGAPSVSSKRRDFDVLNINDTSYRILERITFNSNTQVNVDEDRIYSYRHGLETGDAIHWAPGGTDANYNIGGLTLDTIYYAIKVDRDNFKVAANATDAANSTPIDITAVATTSGYYFRRPNDVAFDNYTIEVLLGDDLRFYVDDTTSGGGFVLAQNTDVYNTSKTLENNNWDSVSYQDYPTGMRTSQVDWDTKGWYQSEDEPSVPEEMMPPYYDYNNLTWGQYGLRNYIYVNDAVPSMKGEIKILPNVSNQYNYYRNPYWKVTIPANGSRSELKLRVYRYSNLNTNSYFQNRLYSITIHSIGSGWTTGESFTITGDQVGGVSPDNDIVFGTRQNESSTYAGDGIAQMYVTNVGSGSSFFQKSNDGRFAVLKTVNDANKKYGTSFFSFSTQYNNDYQMYVNSGSNWHWLNRWGTNSTANDGTTEYGYFDGISGRDYQQDRNYVARNDTSFTYFNYATSSTPTAYPLSIHVYRGQAPQDPNFAIIQFCQTINGVINRYATFTLHKGGTFGSGIWDLNDVYLGSITTYGTGTREIIIDTGVPGDYSGSSLRPTNEPRNAYSKTRDAFYGYVRDLNYGIFWRTRYTCNIDTDNSEDYYNNVVTYYRNSTYDGVDANADYYKPMKGIPICNQFMPCPYYMPDDFVLLQVSTSPGLTAFRTGDTVTVSPSEVYEIVVASYQTQQNGLDNINNNSSIGMLLLARTT